MMCPKCKSENVSVQVISETKIKTKHHSILYWLLIGWWWELLLWLFLTLPKLIFTIFKPKKYRVTNITKSLCVCQNCGYHWESK